MAQVIVIPAIFATFGVVLGWYVAFPVLYTILQTSYWQSAPARDLFVFTTAIKEFYLLPFIMIGGIWLTAFLKAGQKDINIG